VKRALSALSGRGRNCDGLVSDLRYLGHASKSCVGRKPGNAMHMECSCPATCHQWYRSTWGTG